MPFFIDKEPDADYIYRQIYQHLKRLILEHTITSGDKLPSKRQLATDLDVSINSTATAYEQLLAEGYIYTVERKGYFIEDIGHFIQDESNEHQLPSSLKENPHQEKGWLPLSHIQTDYTMFPFRKWLKSEEEAIRQHKAELSEITHPQGPYMVRKTIADMIALVRGVKCEPEQIVIGTGIHPLLHQLMAMQSTDSTIALENPGYTRVFRILQSMDIDVLPTALDDAGIDMREINQSQPDFLFVTPSHQMPTGTIMPISRRVELLNWAAEKQGRYIIEDDYDSEFKYGTDNIPSLQGLDQHNSVIYFGAFSKTLLPGFRISYMVLPPKMLELYRYHYSDWIQGCSSLHLYTLHYFIQSGEYNKHTKRMSQHYREKRKYLINELYATFKDNIHIKDIPAGLHFFTEFKSQKSYETIIQKAEQERLEIYTIKHFLMDDSPPPSDKVQLIIGFANITFEQIPEAVDRLSRVIE